MGMVKQGISENGRNSLHIYKELRPNIACCISFSFLLGGVSILDGISKAFNTTFRSAEEHKP